MEVIQTTNQEVQFGPPLEITEPAESGASPNDRARYNAAAYASTSKKIVDACLDGIIDEDCFKTLLSAWNNGIDSVHEAIDSLGSTMDTLSITHSLLSGTIGATEACDLTSDRKAAMEVVREAKASLNTVSHTIMTVLIKSGGNYRRQNEPDDISGQVCTIVSGVFRGHTATLINRVEDEHGRMTSVTVELTDVKEAVKPWIVSLRVDQLTAGVLDLEDYAPGDLVQITAGAFRGQFAIFVNWAEDEYGRMKDELTVELHEAAVPVALTIRADCVMSTGDHPVIRVDDDDDDEDGFCECDNWDDDDEPIGFEGLGALFG